jgi:hypothetical protein
MTRRSERRRPIAFASIGLRIAKSNGGSRALQCAMDSHYAPNTECVDCAPTGNRFMTHIRTHPGRTASPPSDDALRVLVYQCINCRRLRSEAYDVPQVRRRTARPIPQGGVS